MKKLILAILCGLIAESVRSLNSLYSLTTDSVDYSSETTPVVANSALGSCTCDKTLNSCDIYCCCDNDCSAEVLEYWNNNYNTYCTKAYISNQY